MSEELGEVGFQRFWRRLQQLGLNAYESRSYLVLLGHPKFKALELAEVDFQRFWRRLQQLGLNAYESRSYLVLLGHHKFKAL